MAGMFGTAGGTSAALGDLQTLANTRNLQAEVPLRQAQLQETQARAEKERLQIEQTRKQIEVMTQIAAGRRASPEDSLAPEDQLISLGNLYLNSGLTEQGGKLIAEGDRAKASKASARHAEELANEARQKQELSKLARFEQLLSTATDQRSWEAAKMQWMAQNPGDKNPYLSLPYSPDLVNRLLLGTQGGRKELEGQIKVNADRRASENAKGLAEYRKRQAETAEKNAETRRLRLDRGQKTGAAASVPSKVYRERAMLLVKQNMPTLPPEQIDDAGFKIASRAAQLLKANRGLDAASALEQAYQEESQFFTPSAQTHSLWETLKEAAGISKPGTKMEYSRKPGKSPDRPLPMEMDPKKLQDGMFYNWKGQTLRWDQGKGKFYPAGGQSQVGQSRPAARASAPRSLAPDGSPFESDLDDPMAEEPANE